MATEARTEKAADPLRSLRRGLQRAEDFTLFVAVCNSPLEVEDLTESLREAMPGYEFDVVRLDEKTENPLDDVLEQVRTEAPGPVMVLGLEKSNRSLDPRHPVLGTLNMSRPRWRRLPRPVVLWVPEYLLGLLEREAPDFLDWRSDTFLFPEVSPDALKPLADRAWAGGTDGRMPVTERRGRIEELRSRLATTKDARDPVVLDTSADWWQEIGNHSFFLGDVADAEEAYHRSLEIYVRLDQRDGIATSYHHLGWIAEERDSYEEALDWYLRALRLNEELGDRVSIANSYHQLGLIAQKRGFYDEAFEWYKKTLAIDEKLGNRDGMASSYHQLGRIAQERASYDEALDWYRESLRIHKELGDRSGLAASYHQLGRIAQERGFYDEASDWYQKSLRIEEALGIREGMASSFHQLGRIAEERGSHDEALDWYRKSLQIEEALGNRTGMAFTLSQMGILYTRRGNVVEAVAFSLRSWIILRDVQPQQLELDLYWLRRQRELLGDVRFRGLLAESLSEADVASLLEDLDSTDSEDKAPK